jgi:hypothetical protein
VQATEEAGTSLEGRVDFEILFPHRSVAQVFWKVGAEQIGRLEQVSVTGNDEVLVHHDDLLVRDPTVGAPSVRGRKWRCTDRLV